MHCSSRDGDPGVLARGPGVAGDVRLLEVPLVAQEDVPAGESAGWTSSVAHRRKWVPDDLRA